MKCRSLLFSLTLCAGQLCAQDRDPRPEAPDWGVAVLLGRETGDRLNSYGNNYGVELTWQFLRDHWVQGRLRGSAIQVGKGAGAPDGMGYVPQQANFLLVSCDWIFRPMKAHGPYLLLGAGLNYHHSSRYYLNATDTQTGTNLALAWGAGWLIGNKVEVELRQDALMVDFSIMGSNRDALCTSVVLRKRF